MATLAAVVAGCATGPAFVAPEAPNAGKVAVYVYRVSSIFGAGIKHQLLLDGRPLGTLVNGSYLRVEAPAGAQSGDLGSFGCSSPSQPLILRPGHAAYVQLTLISKTVAVGGRYLFDYGCEMLPRSEEEAVLAMKGLPRAD